MTDREATHAEIVRAARALEVARICGAIQARIDQAGRSSILDTDLMRGSIGGLTTALRIARETPDEEPPPGDAA